MTQTRPIQDLRVDQIGSLLRPAILQDAFARHAAGELNDGQLRSAQDVAIRDTLDHQERLDMPVVTDGEFRRRVFMNSFAVVSGWTLSTLTASARSWTWRLPETRTPRSSRS